MLKQTCARCKTCMFKCRSHLLHAQAAFWGMVLVPWAMWFVATGLGLAHYDGAVGAPKELLEHLLAAYDRQEQRYVHVFDRT